MLPTISAARGRLRQRCSGNTAAACEIVNGTGASLMPAPRRFSRLGFL